MATVALDLADPIITSEIPKETPNNGNGNSNRNGNRNGNLLGNLLNLNGATPTPTTTTDNPSSTTALPTETQKPVPPAPEPTEPKQPDPLPVENNQEPPPDETDTTLLDQATASDVPANPDGSTIIETIDVTVPPPPSSTFTVKNSPVSIAGGLNPGSSLGIVIGLVVAVCVIVGFVLRKVKKGKERDLEGGDAVNRNWIDPGLRENKQHLSVAPSYGYSDESSSPISPVPMLFAIPKENEKAYFTSAFIDQQQSESNDEIEIETSIDYDKYRSVYSDNSLTLFSPLSSPNETTEQTYTERTYAQFLTTPVLEEPRNFSLISDGSEFSNMKDQANKNRHYESVYSEASSVEILVDEENEQDEKPLPSKPASRSSALLKSSPLRNTMIFQDDDESDTVGVDCYGDQKKYSFATDDSGNRGSWMTDGSAGDMEFDGGLSK